MQARKWQPGDKVISLSGGMGEVIEYSGYFHSSGEEYVRCTGLGMALAGDLMTPKERLSLTIVSAARSPRTPKLVYPKRKPYDEYS